MKRTFGNTLGMVALTLLASSCDQPKINCTTGHGDFAAKYTLKAGSKTGDGACDALPNERIGVEKYNPASADDPKKQDLSKAILAIRAARLGGLSLAAESAMVKDENHSVVSLGGFVANEPDDNDVCSVPSLSPAEQDLPAFDAPAVEPDQEPVHYPATNVKYEWSNVRLQVTYAYPGTQLVGDLVYTEDGCSASYSVLALWPAVSCEETDEMGNGLGKPLPSLCDPAAGAPINPDFAGRIECDPASLLCVLSSPPDVLK